MTKRALQAWRRRLSESLTLRRRLTLWTAGLLFALGFGLTALIGGLMAIRMPEAVSVYLEPTILPEDAGVQLLPLQLSPPASLLPPASPTPSWPDAVPPLTGAEDSLVVEQVREVAVREVRLVSLIGVGVFTLLGALGAHWIAQQGLRPVQRLSRLVQEVRADALGRRLSIDGPQDEVRELADAFDSTLERLERAFEQQGRFVADAAHELRTPLATLRTNLEVVRRDPDATLAEYRETVAVLERALERLEALVAGLLLLARGEGEIRVEPVDLEVVLVEVVQALEPLAQTHQVSLDLKIADEVVLQADASLLAQAVANLIENGIRYNYPGGLVTVTVRREEDGVVVSVEDTGTGISLEEQSRIFERFYRVDRSRARHRGGAGLGLSIARHIVQLHRGCIQVDSTAGEGSTFTVWLPCHASISSDMQG